MPRLFPSANVRVAVVGATLLLIGCAETWTKPGATPQEFDAAQAACTAQANSSVPRERQEVQMSPGYFTPMQTRCSGTGAPANCYSGGGQYVSPVTTTVDRNQELRRTAVRACLYDGGWRPAE